MATYGENQINELRNIIMSARYNYDVCSFLINNGIKRKYEAILDKYASFFRIAVDAHFTTLIISLYKLYEQRRDTITLPGFKKYTKETFGIMPEKETRIKGLLKEATQIWNKIYILRNNVYGHKNLEKDVNDFFHEAQIEPEEIERLIDLSIHVFDELNNITSKGKVYFNLTPKTDLEELMDDVTPSSTPR